MGFNDFLKGSDSSQFNDKGQTTSENSTSMSREELLAVDESLGKEFAKEREEGREKAVEDFLKDQEGKTDEELSMEESATANNFFPLEYLVRGAQLYCPFGSHKRRLNLPLCHGVYITGRPMIHKLDSLPGDEENISTFGVCNAAGYKEALKVAGIKAKKINLKRDSYHDAKSAETANTSIDDGEDVVQEGDATGEDLGNIRGLPCIPDIVSPWMSTHDKTKIVENCSDADIANQKDGKEITGEYLAFESATTDSFLVCNYGGIIQVDSSGQGYIDVISEGYKEAQEIAAKMAAAGVDTSKPVESGGEDSPYGTNADMEVLLGQIAGVSGVEGLDPNEPKDLAKIRILAEEQGVELTLTDKQIKNSDPHINEMKNQVVLEKLYGSGATSEIHLNNNKNIAKARILAETLGLTILLTDEQEKDNEDDYTNTSEKVIDEQLHIIVGASGASYSSYSGSTFNGGGVSVDMSKYTGKSIDILHKDAMPDYPTKRFDDEDTQFFHANKVAEHERRTTLAGRLASAVGATRSNYYMFGEYYTSINFHQGIDISGGSEQRCPISGTLIEFGGTLGKFAVYNENAGVTFVFLHLSIDSRFFNDGVKKTLLDPRSVDPNDSSHVSSQVSVGDVMGSMSNAGTVAVHTHLEIRQGESSTASNSHASATDNWSGAIMPYDKLGELL